MADASTATRELVERLAKLPKSELETLMSGADGKGVLDGIFTQMVAHFDPAKAKGSSAVARYVITDGPTGDDVYELRIHDGVCELAGRSDAAGRHVLTITMNRVTFVRVLTGQSNAAKLYLARKIKMDGDMKFGIKVVGWFDLSLAGL